MNKLVGNDKLVSKQEANSHIHSVTPFRDMVFNYVSGPPHCLQCLLLSKESANSQAAVIRLIINKDVSSLMDDCVTPSKRSQTTGKLRLRMIKLVSKLKHVQTLILV